MILGIVTYRSNVRNLPSGSNLENIKRNRKARWFVSNLEKLSNKNRLGIQNIQTDYWIKNLRMKDRMHDSNIENGDNFGSFF